MSNRKDMVTDGSRENIRTGESVEALTQAILDHLYFIQGRVPELATRNDWYAAVAYAVRLCRFPINDLYDLARARRSVVP